MPLIPAKMASSASRVETAAAPGLAIRLGVAGAGSLCVHAEVTSHVHFCDEGMLGTGRLDVRRFRYLRPS